MRLLLYLGCVAIYSCDVSVTEMVQDRVCVVTRENSSRCIDQDILFLGLGQDTCVCVCVCVVTVLEDVSCPSTVCPDLPQTLAVS